VHGPFALGGLAIPHLDTVQGIDKLHMFLGHLRLEDETGQLIVIDLSVVQLVTGMPHFFMNEDPTDYHWVETGWLTSLWRFVYMAKMTLIYPSQWLPPAPRVPDKFLMEHFLNQKQKRGIS
jgi:hypothetical protein